MKYELVKFNCVVCGASLGTESYTTGQIVGCPSCDKTLVLDVYETPRQNVVPQPDAQGVPVKIGLGEGGSLQTIVSKQGAGRLAHTVLGGALVAAGAVLGAMFGVKFSKRS